MPTVRPEPALGRVPNPGLPSRLTQARLGAAIARSLAARAIGVGVETLRTWETGLAEPRASDIVALARLYRVRVSTLLGAP